MRQRTILAVASALALFATATWSDDQTPEREPYHVAARAPAFGGELLGYDDGEWGGQLVFKNAAGERQVVLKTNTPGLAATREGVFAFTGLAHLTLREGAIWELKQDATGRVVARQIIELPGPPGSVRQRDGQVTFQLFTGGRYLDGEPIFKCMEFRERSVTRGEDCGPPPW